MLSKKKELLGRIWIDIDQKFTLEPTRVNPLKVVKIMRSEKKWYTMVYDATGELEGDLLIGYDLIPMNDKINVSSKILI